MSYHVTTAKLITYSFREKHKIKYTNETLVCGMERVVVRTCLELLENGKHQ